MISTISRSSTKKKKLTSGNESFISQGSQESWYTDFVRPQFDKLLQDNNADMIKLGPLNISKTERCGYTYYFLGDKAHEDDHTTKLLIPEFLSKFILKQESSSVKEMLSALRRESLLIIVNYQFGFRRLDKIN